ncbi:MAG: hypothetical protein H0V89_14295 [Deltaproteobacteria bacterium]|nr:hypothetical protein [Deltaproteobacteria bacterium]
MMRFLPILLAGCPYVFGPLESTTSDDSPDADTDSDTDADTDSDTDADTDADVTGSPPTLALANPSVTVDRLTLAISAVDPDNDLISGTLVLFDAGAEIARWSVPNQFVTWDPIGLSTVEYYFALPCEGWAPDLSHRMTDFAGNTSAPFALTFQVGGLAVPAGIATDVGVEVTELPVTWCSTADWIDDVETPMPELEHDLVSFANPVAEELAVTVTWDPAEEVDIDLQVNTSEDIAAATDGFAMVIVTGSDAVGSEIVVDVYPYQPANNAPNPLGPWDYQVVVQVAP